MQVQNKKRKTRTKVPLLGKLLALLPISCILLYPLWVTGQLKLEEKTVWSEKLPDVFDGLTICYVSDIHYGPYLSRERVEKLVERINALSPDIIALGGDYGRDSLGALEFFSFLPKLNAKLCVVGVVGNHDRTVPDSRLTELMNAMQQAGVTPLVNEALTLQKDGNKLTLCGADDFYNGFPDLSLIQRKSAGSDYTIFLPHTPDFLAEMDSFFFDLALCGHTHGGQVTLFGHALKSSSNYGNRYLTGWKKEKGADILISNGVGTSFLPIRLGAFPQFHLITLKSGKP